MHCIEPESCLTFKIKPLILLDFILLSNYIFIRNIAPGKVGGAYREEIQYHWLEFDRSHCSQFYGGVHIFGSTNVTN